MIDHDFGGWATRNDLKCSDGRVIRRDAFKHCDGAKVPLMWGHQHDDPMRILGHAILQNRKEGVYAYCKFNDTEQGINAKKLVQHGDIVSLSIYANRLKQNGSDVIHGDIKELSLVWAGANPGAFIDSIIKHGEESDEEAIIYTGLTLCHSEEEEIEETAEVVEETEEEIEHSEEEKTEGKTVGEVFNGAMKKLDETEQKVVYAIIGEAVGQSDEDEDDEVEHSEGGENTMKRNAFEKEDQQVGGVLTHADQESIIKMAKASNCGSLKAAIAMHIENNKETLAHGIDDIETLFPEYKDVRPGAPELIERDQTWVGHVMKKTHKSPISRIRTRQADARGKDLRAHGYQEKGDEKTLSGNIKLLSRTTDPQTVYRKDALHRDDIIDITDFSVPEYMYGIMRRNLEEDLALAIMVGDLREDGDPDKIHQEHIRSIWHDDDLYCIHYDVDVAAARKELQGTDTNKHFGDNYVYAEALVTASLYSREGYKGSGNLEFYCTPHLLNVMLLARDMNGRRIYDSKADLEKALNVSAIHTAEQFEGLVRTDKDGKKKKLLGLFVNLADYQIGSTKGGEITRFNQFDIDFNQEKYLIETRLSGALTRIWSAIALEEPVEEEAAG